MHLLMSAHRALYGEVGPSLVRFTGEYRENTVYLQWVLLDSATEDEIEDYRCVGTEIIADYADAMIEEEFVSVSSPGNARQIAPLTNPFFCSKLLLELA
jgi:hypothetical protein